MNDPKNRNAAYLRILMGLMFVLVLAVGIFNVLIDSFGLIGIIDIKGFNHEKHEFGNGRERLGKALAVYFRKPNGIFLGSSTTACGLDPENPYWRKQVSNPYNSAVPAGSVYEILRYYQHAQQVGDVTDAVVGLELSMFQYTDGAHPIFSESWMAVTPDGRWQPPWLYAVPAGYLSLDALLASIRTITMQGKPYYGYLPDGRRDLQVFKDRLRLWEGPYRTFYRLQTYITPAETRKQQERHVSKNLEHLHHLLSLARHDGVRLRIVLSPRHAWAWEAKAVKGEWDFFEEWKRQLVQTLEQEAEEAGATPFPLWDFATYNRYTTEPLPPDGDTEARMKWYWEWSHYKKELGDFVLERILTDDQCPTAPPENPPAFGACLTSRNLETHLANQRAAQEEFLAYDPTIRRAISEIYEKKEDEEDKKPEQDGPVE